MQILPAVLLSNFRFVSYVLSLVFHICCLKQSTQTVKQKTKTQLAETTWQIKYELQTMVISHSNRLFGMFSSKISRMSVSSNSHATQNA